MKVPIQDFIRKEVEFARLDWGFNIVKFMHCTVAEFLGSMQQIEKFKRYPFFFINSATVEAVETNIDDTIINIGEMVIATAFNDRRTYTSEIRDNEAFKPLLTPFLNAVLFRLNNSQNIAVYKKGKIVYQYRYTGDGKKDSDVMNDAVCAIKLTNFQFRILTIKNN